MTVQVAAEALGFKTPSRIFDLLAQRRLTGRRVRNERGTRRWDIDSESVAAEKERRECAAQPSSRYRPVHFVLRDIHDAMRAGEL